MRLPSVSLNHAERLPGNVAIIVLESNSGMEYFSNTTPRERSSATSAAMSSTWNPIWVWLPELNGQPLGYGDSIVEIRPKV